MTAAPRSSGTVATGLAHAGERTLPTSRHLIDVLPHLQRGTTIACTGAVPFGSALAVIAEASARGSWVVVAGAPHFGVIAAEQAGVALDRLVAIPGERFTDAVWADTLAAAIDGFDLIVLGPGVDLRPSTARRLQARLQARGAVLVIVGSPRSFTADVEIESVSNGWGGLGLGHGSAERHRVAVAVRGRRIHHPRRAIIVLPLGEELPPDGEAAETDRGSRQVTVGAVPWVGQRAG